MVWFLIKRNSELFDIVIKLIFSKTFLKMTYFKKRKHWWLQGDSPETSESLVSIQKSTPQVNLLQASAHIWKVAKTRHIAAMAHLPRN